MQKKRIFTWLTLMSAVVCLAAFAWAENSVNTAPATPTTVTNSTDLRTAVANEGSGDIIVISGNIDMETTSLSIPAGRNVTLSLDLGSRLDFSNVTEKVAFNYNEYYTGIYNLGSLTIAGSGEIVMSKSGNEYIALIYCSGDASLNVTGGSITANNSNGTFNNYVYAIYNGANSSVTVTGGSITASSVKYRNYAIYNNGANSSVTVTGGSLIASGDYYNNYAICNDGANSSVTVTGGSLIASGHYNAAIHNNGANSSVTVTGGSLIASGDSNYAICNDGENLSVTVTGGSLTVNGGNLNNYAVYNSGGNSSVTVTGGSIIASGDLENYAIYNDEENFSVTVTGGILTARGDNANNYAICNYGGDNAFVTVTGGSLTANGDDESNNYAIYNEYGNAFVTVTGGSLTARGDNANNYAIYNDGSDNAFVTVTGGNITASSGTACYAIYNNKATVVTVLSGNFVGDLSGRMETTTLYGGTYKGCARTGFKGLIAPGCTWKDVDGNIRITNCSSLSLGGAKFKGGEYRCYVAPGIGETITLSADLTSGDESIAILSFDAIDAGLPRSLDVTTSSADKEITITNNGLTEGTYRVTITAEGANSRKAYRTLNITVSDVPEPEDVNVSSPDALKSALGYIWIDSVTLSDDYSGTVTEEITIASDKTLYLNDQRLAFADSGIIIVPEGTSLDIIGPGTVSKDRGPIFNVNGKVTLSNGKYRAEDGKYFTDETPAECVTIAEKTEFYFADDETKKEFEEKFLAENGLRFGKGKDGWYTVERSDRNSSSSGCNAGFAALALMGLAFVPTRKKK